VSPATAIEWGLIAAGIAVAIIAVVNTLAAKKAKGAEPTPAAIVQPAHVR
jgi:hypothetical protein